MTKIIIHGVEPKEEKKLKPIEFVRHTSDLGNHSNSPVFTPNEFKEINVFKRTGDDGLDLFVCYSHEGFRSICFGNLNDGVIE